MRWLLVLGLLWPAAAEARPARDVAVGVGTREFSVAVYRPAVKPGTIRLNVSNLGEDAHNIVVRGPKGHRIASTRELRPGERQTLRLRLRRVGRYTLTCTVADHEARGMRARLRVSRRAPR